MRSVKGRKALTNTRLGLDCAELAEAMDRFVRDTLAAVPGRRNGFVLDRESSKAKYKVSKNKEAALERDLYRQWGPTERIAQEFLPGYCRWLQSFQVPLERPLRDPGWSGTDAEKKRQFGGWGDIDLLGVGPQGLPIIVELKAANASDPLHQVIVEGAAYAIALRSMWNDPKSSLSQEWAHALKRSAVEIDPTRPLKEISVLCLAPEEYWREVDRRTAKTGQAIATLIDAFKQHDILISFAELSPTARLRKIPGS